MSSRANLEEGQLGFVLIPQNDAILSQQVTQRIFWPALMFSSHDALLRALPFSCGQRSFQTEWKHHEIFFISMWKRTGLISPEDGPVKIALLLGTEVPPCATRSFPVCPQDMPAVAGGAMHKPYVTFSKHNMGAFAKNERYASNNQFQEAVDLAKQYMDRRDSKSACASLKWQVFPNGLYHGADPWGYTVEGYLYWNGDFHRVPALPSEVELEQSYPTYKFHPRPPMKETYEQKSSRIHQMQLSSCKFAQMRTKAAKPSGVSEKTI